MCVWLHISAYRKGDFTPVGSQLLASFVIPYLKLFKGLCLYCFFLGLLRSSTTLFLRKYFFTSFLNLLLLSFLLCSPVDGILPISKECLITSSNRFKKLKVVIMFSNFLVFSNVGKSLANVLSLSLCSITSITFFVALLWSFSSRFRSPQMGWPNLWCSFWV